MLRYQTVGIRTTRTIFARIDTVAIDAGFVQRTIWIVSASDGDTSREGVAFKAFMAAAIGNVILRETEGVRSTRIVEQAGIDTGAFNAGFRVFTFGVGLASWINTGNQRIANLARRTSTHWFMAFNETFSSFATIRKKVISIYVVKDDSRSIFSKLVIFQQKKYFARLGTFSESFSNEISAHFPHHRCISVFVGWV